MQEKAIEFPLYIISLFIIFSILLTATCRKNEKSETNPILTVTGRNSEMHNIQTAALARLPEFIRKLQTPAKDEYDFQVKYPIKTEETSSFEYEYIWLKNITFREGRYFGIIANEPLYNKKFRIGNEMEFFMDDIADWMYRKGNYIEGGASIKHLIEKIPPHERSKKLNDYLKLFR